MKNKLTALLTAILSVFFGPFLLAQENSLDPFVKKLDEATSKYAQEKVHLHLDKPYYAIGDDIWFKAYTVNAKTGQPSLISNILYVELINEKDSISTQLKLPMRGGITWGDFRLGDTLTEGNYRIRAYTQWMRNAGTEFFFDKTIKVGNSWANKVFTKSSNVISTENNQQKVTSTIQFTDKQNMPYTNCHVYYEVRLNDKRVERGRATTNMRGEIVINITDRQPNVYKSGFIMTEITLPNQQVLRKDIPLKTTSKDIDVQFFPEGGRVIANLPNKIAIKAINSNGLGEQVEGVILNSQGEEVSRFETNTLGMGSFFINPAEDHLYKAQVEFIDGSQKAFDLPKADKSGTILSVNNIDTSKMSIRVYLSEDLLNKEIYNLIAQHNGTIYFSAQVASNKQVVSLNVPKDSLPSGIVQISLLSSKFLPLNERIVFVNNIKDRILLETDSLKPTYGRREKVKIDLLATNKEAPTKGSFSVAVTNASVVEPELENETNILTGLLLTPDLVGYIEKPNYYFLNDNRNTRADLDHLMLTQGWRKTNWQQIASGEEPTISFPAEKRLQISGIVKKGGEPVVKGKITLVSFTGGFFAVDTLTDEKGRFIFDQIEFRDSTKFVVQARTDKERKYVDITLDAIPPQMVTKNPNTGDIEVNINQSLEAYLKESDKYFDDLIQKGLLNRTIMLDEVTISEKRKPVEIEDSSNLNGPGNADVVFTAKDLETALSLEQYLQGKVPGVSIIGGVAYLARGNSSPMSIVLDGMHLDGEDIDLNNFVVQDIQSIEILKSIGNTAVYGARGWSGVIVITTKKGEGLRGVVNPYTPGVIQYSPKGYAVIREFYSPKYDVKPDDRPDLRTTVFWEPQLVTNAEGKVGFSYFNTDVPGNYRIVVEGINVEGSLARQEFTYEVK